MDKGKLESLLAEGELSNLAFSIVERFSTHEKLSNIISSIFSLVGNSLNMWSDADYVTHIFVNETLEQSHRLICQYECNNYEAHNIKPPIPSYTPYYSSSDLSLMVKKLPKEKNDPLLRVTLPSEILEDIKGNLWITSLDFSYNLPLGFYSIVWKNKPTIQQPEIDLLQSALWSLSKSISLMLGNHFPIHKTTYLPSFCPEEEKETAILFADIRNSTPLFEIARLGGSDQIKRVELLLKIWLEYSAELISAPGLGHIHHFSGDGIMATFGEYAVDSEYPKPSKDVLACILAIHAGKFLFLCFQELYNAWIRHSKVYKFYSEHNEDIDVTLGIGINYGKVFFGYYGTTCNPTSYSKCSNFSKHLGHLEYNLIGDHVNTAERLESIASKLEKEVDIFYRGNRFKNDFRINPIILSQTVSKRLDRILMEDIKSTNDRRGVVHLKGKGIALPFFELSIKDIDIQYSAIIKDEQYKHYLNCLQNPPDIKDYIKKLINNL